LAVSGQFKLNITDATLPFGRDGLRIDDFQAPRITTGGQVGTGANTDIGAAVTEKLSHCFPPDVADRDKSGNAIHGTAVTADTRNCIIHSNDRLTAVLGARDLVVVSTPDAVLVMPRDRAQDVRELVGTLKSARRPEATDHRRVHRPWGYYDSIDAGERFQVKRIVVQPGGILSLQKHHHRAEHWVVVRGTAEVTIGTDVKSVHENESTYIPLGAVHRLANRGKIPLELIEVQTGSYLGEDDIVRIEDVYKRD